MFGLIWSEVWGQSYCRPWQAKICTSQSYGRAAEESAQEKAGWRRSKRMKNHRVKQGSGTLRSGPRRVGFWLSMMSGWTLYLPFNTWGIGRYDLFLPFPLPPIPPVRCLSLLCPPFPKLGQGPHSPLPWHRVQCWHKVMISLNCSPY